MPATPTPLPFSRSWQAGLLALALASAASLAGCGEPDLVVDDGTMPPPGAPGGTDPMKPTDPTDPPRPADPPPLGAPLDVKPDTWTWVDFPDAVCDDGSPTGIAVNPHAGSKKLLVFLMGGGACWDYLTCAVINSSTHGPQGKKEWESSRGIVTSSVLDRSASHPFGDYNLVFVPYCTGDVHSGDNVATYEGFGQKKVVHHKGRANLLAFMKRIGATFRDSEKVVLSGSSAGGFGVAVSYDLMRRYFPAAKGYMLDDSGPILVKDDVPKDRREAWIKSWGLTPRLLARCPECVDDLSAMLRRHAMDYPRDRLALLSYTQDRVIRSFLGLRGGPEYEQNLKTLAGTFYEATPNARCYYVTGEDHTFLGSPGKTTAQGVRLSDWLAQFESDSQAWASTKP
jgi:hypothetical protein